MRTRRLFQLVLLAFVGTLAGCASTPSEDAESRYKSASTRAAGDTQGAIKDLEGAVSDYPDFPKMRFLLARLQYEVGESQHLEQLAAMRAARQFDDERKKDDAAKAYREAEDRRSRAMPFYRAARENLKIVVDHEKDQIRRAWAYYILQRCDVFFEDYEQAIQNFEKAIELGKPSGAKLAQWQELLADYRKKVRRGP